MSLWLVMIVLHAALALVCFATGLALLSPSKLKEYRWLVPVFLASLVGMIVFMIAATVSHWNEISVTERAVFSALPILGFYMLYRGIKAKRHLKQGKPLAFINDIGFTLISLFNGFIIVALIDLGAPVFLIPVAAVAATLIGNRFIKASKQKVKG